MKPYLQHPDDSEDLFARARRNDPDTSHEAAASVRRIKPLQAAILGILMQYGPQTDEGIAEWLYEKEFLVSPSGARSRRAELVSMGIVIDSGERKLTKSNRKTIVWKLRP